MIVMKLYVNEIEVGLFFEVDVFFVGGGLVSFVFGNQFVDVGYDVLILELGDVELDKLS